MAMDFTETLGASLKALFTAFVMGLSGLSKFSTQTLASAAKESAQKRRPETILIKN
jgi:hypothetical protein